MRVRLLALLAALSVAQSSAQAQQTTSGPAAPGVQAAVPVAPPQMRRWSVTFDTGGMFGGPGGDIEDAMRAAHLDLSGIFGSESPKTHFREGLPVLVEAQYRIREPWSVGVLLGRSLIGTTHGNGPGFMSIRANYSVTSVAAMLSAGPRSIQIGLGPALHLARSRSGALGGGQSPPWSETALSTVIDYNHCSQTKASRPRLEAINAAATR